MTHPIRREFQLSDDRYSRNTRLIATRESGFTYWSIISSPVNQRDDGEKIASLTTTQMREIAAIIAGEPST